MTTDHEFIICICGCGKTRSIKRSDNKNARFIKGHNLNLRKIEGGNKHPAWKGGINYSGDGYKQVWNPNHHFADVRGYIRQHRLVYEEFYKCVLLPWAHIHHINGIRDDNRIENLEVMTNKQHANKHGLGVIIKPSR